MYVPKFVIVVLVCETTTILTIQATTMPFVRDERVIHKYLPMVRIARERFEKCVIYSFYNFKLGNADREVHIKPITLDIGKVAHVVHGREFSCVIVDGKVQCSGTNGFGQVFFIFFYQQFF